MELKNLSKLQIRAEVLLILRQFNALDEMSKEQQDKCLNKIRLIKDNDYVLEILVKELPRNNYKKGQIISFFLQDLGSLEKLHDVLWSYIKSPDTSDELKDLAGITLKNLGDQTDPEEFLNYLKDPKAIVDKETQKLLEVASVNPEAQIDFLDFLFSLPENEQINLITSLKNDFPGESLVNVAVPALESKASVKLQEELIKILGETRSASAIPALNNILKYSEEEILKKQAQRSLSILKLAGIRVENENEFSFISPITKISEMYECHTNIVDGIGNQGIIISRIKPNQDILMLNVIVNDIHGIIDCFGFYGISKHDFKRIIEKFQEKTTRFFASPEYCRFRLDEAEKINKINNLPIPYEYAAWKSIISDITPLETDFEDLTKQWVSKNLINETALLYKFPDFQHWFFEEDDHPLLKDILDNLIKEAEEKSKNFIKNNDKLKLWLDSNIDILSDKIFNDEIKNIYRNRLIDITYMLNFQELPFFRDISASLSWSLKPENNYDLKTIPFFRELIKRTILQEFLRYQYNIEKELDQSVNAKRWGMKNKQQGEISFKIIDKNLEEVINILCNM